LKNSPTAGLKLCLEDLKNIGIYLNCIEAFLQKTENKNRKQEKGKEKEI
jgi:hypothetical protein